LVNLELRFRLEPGCLGPDGKHYIEAFCQLINRLHFSVSGIQLSVFPRYDKSLSESEFLLEGKLISSSQAQKLLSLTQHSITDIEDSIDDFITTKIEQFMTSVKKYEGSQGSV
jgi:hypothetical protein